MNSNAARGRQQHRVKYEPPPHYFVHRTNDRLPARSWSWFRDHFYDLQIPDLFY